MSFFSTGIRKSILGDAKLKREKDDAEKGYYEQNAFPDAVPQSRKRTYSVYDKRTESDYINYDSYVDAQSKTDYINASGWRYIRRNMPEMETVQPYADSTSLRSDPSSCYTTTDSESGLLRTDDLYCSVDGLDTTSSLHVNSNSTTQPGLDLADLQLGPDDDGADPYAMPDDSTAAPPALPTGPRPTGARPKEPGRKKLRPFKKKKK